MLKYLCEVDPRYFTKEHMDVLKAGGFNRLSFGVQDLDETVQKRFTEFNLLN